MCDEQAYDDYLGLEVDRLAMCKAKMANNLKVHCAGIIHFVRVKTFGIEVNVDMFVMHTKGEGYSTILWIPWPMAMKTK